MTKKKQTKAKTGAERQAAYAKRMKEHGVSRVSAWVPDSERDAFWAAYDELRELWERSKLFPES